MLVANKFLAKAGDDLSDKHPGDPIPEAAKWPNLRMYLAHKWIIDTGDVVAVEAIPHAPAVVAPSVPQVSVALNPTSTTDTASPTVSDLHKPEPPLLATVDAVPVTTQTEPTTTTEAAPKPKRRGRWSK